jgi:ribonuclease P protein component
MLKKKNRASKKDIEEIFKDGSFFNASNLSFKFKVKKGFFGPKISFLVPKIVAKNAVKRNKLKRLGYLALEKYINLIPKEAIGVFLFSKKANDLLKQKKEVILSELEKEIVYILNKIVNKK